MGFPCDYRAISRQNYQFELNVAAERLLSQQNNTVQIPFIIPISANGSDGACAHIDGLIVPLLQLHFQVREPKHVAGSIILAIGEC